MHPPTCAFFLLKILKVSTWFKSRQATCTVTMMLALTKLDVLLLLTSRAFRSSKRGDMFFAPLSERSSDLISVYGLWGNFLEDLPQIIIQLVKKK